MRKRNGYLQLLPLTFPPLHHHRSLDHPQFAHVQCSTIERAFIRLQLTKLMGFKCTVLFSERLPASYPALPSGFRQFENVNVLRDPIISQYIQLKKNHRGAIVFTILPMLKLLEQGRPV